jgi:hypothetical protein
MAESDYKPTPCAFCGEGEPSPLPSSGLCILCRARTLQVGELRVVLDTELGRLVVLAPVDSDNIARAGWRVHGGSGILALEFRQKLGAATTADVFRYANVGRDWWTTFLASESKGRFFHQTVRADKAAHPFTKIA